MLGAKKTKGAAVTIEHHFGIHYTSESGEHLVNYETDEVAARRDFRPGKAGGWLYAKLLTQKVTYGAWHPAPGRAQGNG